MNSSLIWKTINDKQLKKPRRLKLTWIEVVKTYKSMQTLMQTGAYFLLKKVSISRWKGQSDITIGNAGYPWLGYVSGLGLGRVRVRFDIWLLGLGLG